MKKLTVLFLALSLSAFAGCKKDEAKKDDKKAATKPTDKGDKGGDKMAPDKAGTPDKAPTPPPAAEVKLVSIDLTPGGDDWKGMTIMAPEGATVKAGPLAVEVQKGDHFFIEVNNSKADIAARKKEIQENDVNKLKSFTTDSPDALVYESQVMDKGEFHFVGNVKVGDKDFYCEDSKGPVYTADDVAAMWKSCQSLAAAKK